MARLNQDAGQLAPLDQQVIGPFDDHTGDPGLGHRRVGGSGREHRQPGDPVTIEAAADPAEVQATWW